MLRTIYYSSQYYSKHDRYFVATLTQTVVTIFSQLRFKPVLSFATLRKNNDLPDVTKGRHRKSARREVHTITTTNTKDKHSDKVIIRMTFHALNDPEDEEP